VVVRDQLSTGAGALDPRGAPFRLGAIVVRPDRHELDVNGRIVRLEPRLMSVLTELAAHGGETVRREQLLDAAWDEDGADEALTLAISRLRRALGAHGCIIATVPKRGYRLTVIPAPISDAGKSSALQSRKAPRWLPAVTLAIGIVVGIYTAVWAHRDDFGDGPTIAAERIY